MKELQGRTGSRLGDQSSPITVIEHGTSRFGSGSDYYGNIKEELETRMLLLKEIGGFADLDTDPNRINLHDLERRVLLKIEIDTD